MTLHWVSDVPLPCISKVAVEYHIPTNLIISILHVERGKVGLAKRNTNGSYDLGPFQINTSWWPTLSAYGITKQEVLYNPCTNAKVATWILSKAIANANGNDLVVGISNYHSYNWIHNHPYALRVRNSYQTINQSLKGDLAP